MSGTQLSGDIVSQVIASQSSLYISVLGVLIILLWLSVLVRVLKDSIARSNNIFFHIVSILLVTVGTPFIGLPIYLAIRPINYSPSKYFGRSVLFALTTQCPECAAYNDRTNAHCTQCACSLLVTCGHCHSKVSYEDSFCPHCGKTLTKASTKASTQA